MAYADYTYYTEQFLGTAIKAEEFPRLSLCASAYLDYYTQGRAAENADMDALKMACCAVAEQYQIIEAARLLASKSVAGSAGNAGELQSQTVGSWSKTYRSPGESAGLAMDAAKSASGALGAVAWEYLAGTGLLYRGRRRCCEPCFPTL